MTSQLVDEFPQVKIGDFAQAKRDLRDQHLGHPVAEEGDLLYVIGKEPGCLVTIQCERTGVVMDAEPGVDFEVLAPEGFASSPKTTPERPLRVFFRRGVA